MQVPESFLPNPTPQSFYKDGAGYFPIVGPHPFTPVGAHTSTILVGSEVLTLSPPDDAIEVLIQILDIDCRFTLSGTEPTASTGFQLIAGDALIISISRSTIIKITGEESGASIEYQFGR